MGSSQPVVREEHPCQARVKTDLDLGDLQGNVSANVFVIVQGTEAITIKPINTTKEKNEIFHI